MLKLLRTTSSEWIVVTFMFLIVTGASLLWQKPNNTQGYDGIFYYSMAQQITQGQSVTGPAPWIYRVGTPFLAATFAPLTGDLTRSFQLINFLPGVITTLLLVIFLRRHVSSVYPRLIVLFLYLTQWHAPVRFAYFYPTGVDYWLMVFVLLALLLADYVGTRYILSNSVSKSPEEKKGDVSRQNTFSILLLLSAVIFAGTLFREVIAIFGITALFITNPIVLARNPTYIRQIKLPPLLHFLPLLGAILALIVSHALVVVNQEGYPYTILGTAYLWLYDKKFLSYIYAWFIAFGPVLMLVIYDWRRVGRFLYAHQDYALYILVLAVLAWIAGTDTERFLYWGMSIFYVLLARMLEEHAAWLLKSPVLIGVLVITQLISQRVFWVTPDFNDIAQPQILPLLTPIGAEVDFEHLQSFYSTLRWLDLSFTITAQYLILAAVLLLWISTRAGQRKNS